MLAIRKKDTATVSNILNEMVSKGLTLQQLRFFLVYLAKINPMDANKTEVTFSLKEYEDILGVELNESNIDYVTEGLMKMIINLRDVELRENELEAKIKIPLFAECRLFKAKDDGQYYLTFECHKRVKNQIFELAQRYTSIQIWNVLNLTSFQDARLYMLLKQYKNVGERTIALTELKAMLGIDAEAYPVFKEFSRTVLKKAQRNLKAKTDISFEYITIGRPARAIKFIIYNNKDYTPPKFLEKSVKGKSIKENDHQIYDQLEGQEEFNDPASMDDYVASYKKPENEFIRSHYGKIMEEYPEFTGEQCKALFETSLKHISPGELIGASAEDKQEAVLEYLYPKWRKIKATPEDTKSKPFYRLLDMAKNDR